MVDFIQISVDNVNAFMWNTGGCINIKRVEAQRGKKTSPKNKLADANSISSGDRGIRAKRWMPFIGILDGSKGKEAGNGRVGWGEIAEKGSFLLRRKSDLDC